MSSESPDTLAREGLKPARATTMSSVHSALARLLSATEIDTRMLGMIGALGLIWIALHVLSGCF